MAKPLLFKSQEEEQFYYRHESEVELAKRELQRKSLDTILVYNPLEHTFAFMYDRYWHRVPAKTERRFPRYLALRFFKAICDKMIGDQIMQQGEALKALREKQMGKQYLDHYEENVQIWDRTPKINDPEIIDQIKKTVIKGVVEEYGMDEPEPEVRIMDKPTDFRPMHEQIFSDIGTYSSDGDIKLPGEMDNMPQEPQEPKKTSKTDLAREIGK